MPSRVGRGGSNTLVAWGNEVATTIQTALGDPSVVHAPEADPSRCVHGHVIPHHLRNSIETARCMDGWCEVTRHWCPGPGREDA